MHKDEDTDPQGSLHLGFLGWYERWLRKYKNLALIVTLFFLYLFVACLLGLSLLPSVLFVNYLFQWGETFQELPRFFIWGTSIILAFFIYGFTAIIIVPIPNLIVLKYFKPRRGPYYSVELFWWYLHNILTYSIRYSFLEWITPTPFNVFFYRQMGMKIGERVEINTTNISDPGLITLEEGVTIGGSATVIAHYGVKGYLIIAPVLIKKNATVGLRAIVMGGVEIGEGSKILPNSVVLPKSIVPAGETWAGIPAKKIK